MLSRLGLTGVLSPMPRRASMQPAAKRYRVTIFILGIIGWGYHSRRGDTYFKLRYMSYFVVRYISKFLIGWLGRAVFSILPALSAEYLRSDLRLVGQAAHEQDWQ